LSIRIFYDNTEFRLKGSRRIGRIFEKVVWKEQKISGDLVFIFTDDETLRKINIEFLNHNYFTDVITFNCGKDEEICGEIYISIDRVKENAINYNVSLKNEILRVMIHGVLHLLGFDDKTDHERKRMRTKEDQCIGSFYKMYDEL
jgi:rRNA maturation RNase YbeY